MNERLTTQTQYRLAWESIDSHVAAAYEAQYGKDCWPRVDWDAIPRGWHRTEVVFTGNERMGQYHALKKWAETREQPIRNVTLEQREVQLDDEGWEPVAQPEEPTPLTDPDPDVPYPKPQMEPSELPTEEEPRP